MKTLVRLASNGSVVVLAIIAVHAGLWLLSSVGDLNPTGDILFAYKPWVDALHVNGKWGGINAEWVYPFVAWVPLLIAKVMFFTDYETAWLLMACILNAFALGQIVGWGRRMQNVKVVWYFLVFIALLGPVAISRLDGISVALALFGVASLQLVASTLESEERLVLRTDRALVWFTVAAWMKVWTVALVLGLLRTKEVFRRQILMLVVTCGAIVGIAALLGANINLFSFLWFQSNRGLQIESPIANVWVWLAISKTGDSLMYFDDPLITWQVTGPGTVFASTLMSSAMLVAIYITAMLIWQGNKAGVSAARLASLGGLTATLDLIVFNKVGSPQYQLWLVVPVAMGLYFGLENWRVPVVATLLLAAVTQVVYPILYMQLVSGNALALSFLTARNIILIAFLVWANLELGKRPKASLAV
jgi:hypothetical protein